VRPDLARAAERGVTTQAIGDTVRIATSGDFAQSLAKLNLDNRQIDIRVKVPEQVRTDMQSIADLRIPGRNGLVPLSSVASLTVESGPSQIDRYARERQITISADLGGYPLGNAIAEAKKLPAVVALPSSVRWIDSGDAEFMAELFGGFGLAMLTGCCASTACSCCCSATGSSPSRSSRPCRCPSAARSSRCCSLAASSDCLR
jgi:multidrug efflux pump subunit AcrB